MENDLKELTSIVFWIKLLVPMITVFSAVLFAQYAFNELARNRENRERRLKRIEILIISTDAIQTQLFDFYNRDQNNFKESYFKILQHTSLLRTSLLIFDLSIIDSLKALEEKLDEIYHARITEDQDTEGLRETGHDEQEALGHIITSLFHNLRNDYFFTENKVIGAPRRV